MAKLTDHFDLCAICDINPAVAEEISAKHGVAQSFTNVAATLDEAKPDLVLILVPTDGQSAVAVEAAKRGINIITEIPYGITLEVGDAIRDIVPGAWCGLGNRRTGLALAAGTAQG